MSLGNRPSQREEVIVINNDPDPSKANVVIRTYSPVSSAYSDEKVDMALAPGNPELAAQIQKRNKALGGLNIAAFALPFGGTVGAVANKLAPKAIAGLKSMFVTPTGALTTTAKTTGGIGAVTAGSQALPYQEPLQGDELQEQIEALQPKIKEDSKTEIKETETADETKGVEPEIGTKKLINGQMHVYTANGYELITPEVDKFKVSDLFGSEEFDRLLRTTGKALTETGDIGRGLAQGSAKAAEERAVKETAIELEKIKAGTKNKPSSELIKKYNDDYVKNTTEMSENAGSLDFLNQIENMLAENDVTGIQSYAKQIGYKFKSIFNADAKMDPKTMVEDLLREISIGNAEEVLGQSSGRLSDKDIELARQLVSEIEGIGGIIGSTDKVLSILARRRADIERSQAKAATDVMTGQIFYNQYGLQPPPTFLFDLLAQSQMGATNQGFDEEGDL
jgi:hypothetical protein|tara:strand:+ start:681 stop:2033 length:1353 start_codon:yes stop_codon:yes gene_type:complete